MVKRNGVYFRVVNYDTVFRHQSSPAIIMNDFNIDLEADRQRLNELIYTSLDGDSLTTAARCGCGKIEGMDSYGVICSNCLSPCVPVTERPLESLLWLRVPAGIKAFFNIQVWRILRRNLTHSNFSILDWLTDPRYKPAGALKPERLRKLERLNFERSYNYFIENYEAILVGLFKANLLGPSASLRRRRKILRFLQMNIDRTFSEYLPFPTKLGFIKENSNNRINVDPKMTTAINAAHIIIGIDNREESENQPPMAHANKESRVVRGLNQFAEYYKTFENDVVFKKPGIMRKLVYGTRPNMGFRSVITSRQKPHQQDGLEMPWSLSVMLFRVHLQNKLLLQGYTPNEMTALIMENTLRFHPEIYRLLNEIKDESPTGTLGTLFGRNPSLTRGSIGYNQIDTFKTDPTDNTVSMSPLNLIDKNKSTCSFH